MIHFINIGVYGNNLELVYSHRSARALNVRRAKISFTFSFIIELVFLITVNIFTFQ